MSIRHRQEKKRFINLGYPSELPTETAALKKWDEILTEVNAPDYRLHSDVMLSDFINRIYVPIELPTKKSPTARDVKSLLRKHIIPKFGQQQMVHITKLKLQPYFLHLMATGLSWNTVNKIKQYASGVYSSAIELDCGIKVNPVRAVKLRRGLPRDRSRGTS